jgi:hypothetical protein
MMSIAQLCAHGCNAIFTDTAITITLCDIVVLTGTRYTTTGGLQTLDPLPPAIEPIPKSTNAAISGSINAMFHATPAHDTTTIRIDFYHMSCYSPDLSTWRAAIDVDNFTTQPSLTIVATRKYPLA